MIASRIGSLVRRRALHSRRTEADLSARLRVIVQPLRTDNYAYVAHEPDSSAATVVDPADAEPVLETLRERDLSVEQILLTHHHDDHIGGVPALLREFPRARVIATDARIRDHIKQTEVVPHGASWQFGALSCRAWLAPGHTSAHGVFDVREADAAADAYGALFAGDTLFVGGCGRLFEGTASELYDSLFNVIFALPKQTLLYCGHEYTEANLRFALSIEPDNGRLSEMAGKVGARRDQKLPTVPQPLHDEFVHNPFVRCRERAIAKRLGFLEWSESDRATHIAVLQQLRDMKDNFQ